MKQFSSLSTHGVLRSLISFSQNSPHFPPFAAFSLSHCGTQEIQC